MRVYVCVTLYHVYISLLMILTSGADKKRNIVFLNANNEKVYQQYCYIGEQLKKRGYICDVRLRSLKSEILQKERVKNHRQLKIVKDQMRKIGAEEFTLVNFAWNNSYVYPSAGLLYRKAKDAIFVEESTLIAKLEQEKGWKKLIHKLMGDAVDFYKDSKLKTILVQKPETFPQTWQSKLKVLDIGEYVRRLSEHDIQEILNIMSQEGTKLLKLMQKPGLGIVYSCPFSEQGVISEEEKISQIVRICEFYQQYGDVVVKLHPRDTAVYPVGEKVTILPGSFPSELLSLTGYRFKFAVSVCSSAVNTTNAEYKINLNESFYNDPVFQMKDINGQIVESEK